jgi:hypothetical protein
MRVLGTDRFDAYLKAYDIPFESDLEDLLGTSVALHYHPSYIANTTFLCFALPGTPHARGRAS